MSSECHTKALSNTIDTPTTLGGVSLPQRSMLRSKGRGGGGGRVRVLDDGSCLPLGRF